MMPEVTHRMNEMLGAYTGVKRSILRNREIPVQARIVFVMTYFLSKGVFQVGTWRGLKIAECKKFHGNVMKIFRAVLSYVMPLWRAWHRR